MKYQNPLKLTFVLGILLASLSIYGQDYEVDLSFNPQFGLQGFPNKINTFELTTGGKILVGGQFVQVNGEGRAHLVRLNPDGTTDPTFSSPLRFLGSQIDDEVLSIRTQADGKILIGGKFPSLGMNVRIARLNSDGTLDATLTTRPTFDIFIAMVKAEPLNDGKFLGCGPFRDANGVAKYGLARFNVDGSLDTTFSTVLGGFENPTCSDLKTLPDGKVMMIGGFSQVNTSQHLGGARLNPDGTLDNGLSFSGLGISIMLGAAGEFFQNTLYTIPDPNDPGGYLYFSGIYKYSLGTGSQLGSFNCNNYPIPPVAVAQADGRTVITGGCSSPWNNSKYQFARFLPNSFAFDQTLDRVDFGSTGVVTYQARQPDGKYILIGQFTNVNGAARRDIVRLQPKTVPTSRPDFDFDGDGKADLAVYRPSEGFWYIYLSAGGARYMPWGLRDDKPVAADYDNDGKTDIAVFRAGDWWIIKSSDGSFERRTFGAAGDTPLVGHVSLDDPIDDKVDMVLRAPFVSTGSNVRWQFKPFSQPFANASAMPGESISDKLVLADLDGDSIDEFGFFRDGYWKTMAIGGSTGINGSPRSLREFFWGTAGDIPVPADYDGDGQADYAVFRPSTGTWWFNATSLGVYSVRFGSPDDVPVPADYDGDGKTDIAIFRNGQWWQILSSDWSIKIDVWGSAGDVPIPAQSRY